MRVLFGYAVYLFIGYIVGLWLAAPGLFSATVALTQWGNIWTWTWMVFWPFILLWHFIVWVAIITAIVLFVMFLIYKLA